MRKFLWQLWVALWVWMAIDAIKNYIIGGAIGSNKAMDTLYLIAVLLVLFQNIEGCIIACIPEKKVSR